MDPYESLMTMVEQGGDLDRAAADRVARGTIEAFFERISGGEARDLAAHLPADYVRPVLVLPDRRPEPFDCDQFVRRVAVLTGADPRLAQHHAELVLTALRAMVGPREYDEAVAQLPADFEPLVAETQRPHVEVHSEVEFVARVADRAGVPTGAARRATEAVLETLGERLPAADIGRLTGQLPGALAAPLARGVADTTAPRRLAADKFVHRVAERTETTPERAHGQARAVFGAVAHTLPEPDFYETVVHQLPNDYAELLAPR